MDGLIKMDAKKNKRKFVLPIKVAEENLDVSIPFLVMQH